MTTAPLPSQLELQGLRSLGDGSSQDRLSFRLIVRILFRCLRLLRPVLRHVLALFAGFGTLTLLIAPLALLFIDTFWTRILQGNPLTEFESAFWGIEPAIGTTAEGFTPEVRSSLARTLVWRGVGIAIVMIPMFMALYYYQVWILQRVNQTLRVGLLAHLQSLSLRFHADARVGDALYRLTQDSSMVTQLVDVLILTPVTAFSQFLYSTVIIALLAPSLAFAMLAVWIPTLALGFWASKRLRIRFRRARETNSALTSRIQETLAGIKVIKAYGAEEVEKGRFDDSSREAFGAAFSARNFFAIYQVGNFWIVGSFMIALTLVATIEVMQETELAAPAVGFTIWNLGLYNFFKARLGTATQTLKDVFKVWGRTQDIAIGLDRVFEVLDLEPEVQDEPDAKPLSGIRESIRFDSVGFAYQPDRPVLEAVDLEARVGTITAIVGPTGSGKSTLMALLLRLFDPTSGRIQIDGVDLQRFQTASLRDQISIALQENVLFGSTVAENIRFAVPGASAAQVKEAARVAAADGFISALPQGYETLLGERGSKLSTGQRQRLSIARAIVKDTPILILDEPTAALDAATELEVLANLAEWGRGRAIFLITHRLSTVRRADQIAFLRGGRIVELGSHDELMAQPGGAYRALVEAEHAAARGEAA